MSPRNQNRCPSPLSWVGGPPVLDLTGRQPSRMHMIPLSLNSEETSLHPTPYLDVVELRCLEWLLRRLRLRNIRVVGSLAEPEIYLKEITQTSILVAVPLHVVLFQICVRRPRRILLLLLPTPALLLNDLRRSPHPHSLVPYSQCHGNLLTRRRCPLQRTRLERSFVLHLRKSQLPV